MTHKLKILPKYFDQVWDRKKNFEIRKNDRNFNLGDKVILFEHDGKKYLNRGIAATITCVLKDCPEYGLKNGYAILGLNNEYKQLKPVKQ